MTTRKRSDKVKVTHDGPTITEGAVISGLGTDLDGRLTFYSPLAAILYQESVEAWNRDLTFATIALAHAAIEHLVEFELAGGNNPLSPRSPIQVDPRTKYERKVQIFVREFRAMKPHEAAMKKLYAHRNTYLHGITDRVQRLPSKRPSLRDTGAREVRIVSPHETVPTGVEFQVWQADGGPDFSDIRDETELIQSSWIIAERSLRYATTVLRDWPKLYQPINASREERPGRHARE